MMKHTRLLGSLAAIGCEVLFGLSYVMTKSATAQASEFALLGWRFALAFLALFGLRSCGAVKISISRKKRSLIFIALLNPIFYFLCETLGISLTTASESGAFLACIPVVTLVMASIFLNEKPTLGQLLGIVITLVGVILAVFAAGVSASFSLLGYLILGLAVLSYALYCIFVEKAKGFSSMEITYFMLLSAALTFSLLALGESVFSGTLAELFTLPLQSPSFLLAVLYQGIGCSILAFFLSNFAISQIGVNRTASFIGLSTIVSILAGVLFLGERFSILQIVAVCLVITGVYTANKT